MCRTRAVARRLKLSLANLGDVPATGSEWYHRAFRGVLLETMKDWLEAHKPPTVLALAFVAM